MGAVLARFLRDSLPMDATDERLLELLRENARASFVDLARHLNTSEGTVRARVKKLQDEGVIRRFTLRTSGANIKTIIEIEVGQNVHTSDISNKIVRWKGIEQVYEITGEHDILVVAEASSTAALNEIIEKIREFPQVKSTRSRLILKEV